MTCWCGRKHDLHYTEWLNKIPFLYVQCFKCDGHGLNRIKLQKGNFDNIYKCKCEYCSGTSFSPIPINELL